MPEKRISKRIAFRSIVRYGPHNPPEHMSFITDLSDTGACIKTNKVFKPGTKLYLSFEIGDNTYKAVGIVQWAKVVPPALVRLVKNGMGIRFTRIDDGLLTEYGKRLE